MRSLLVADLEVDQHRLRPAKASKMRQAVKQKYGPDIPSEIWNIWKHKQHMRSSQEDLMMGSGFPFFHILLPFQHPFRLGALGIQICPDNGGSSVQKRPLPSVTR